MYERPGGSYNVLELKGKWCGHLKVLQNENLNVCIH